MLKSIFWVFVIFLIVLVGFCSLGGWKIYELLGVWGLVGSLLFLLGLFVALIVMMLYCLSEFKVWIDGVIVKIKALAEKIKNTIEKLPDWVKKLLGVEK